MSGLSYGVGSVLDIAKKGLTKKLAREGMETAAESSLKNLLKGLGRYSLTIGSEAGEEALQQTVSIANRERLGEGKTGVADLL